MTANRYQRWTPQDHQTIRTFAGIESAKQIAVRLGRTHPATLEQARLIGVSLQLVGEHHHAARYSDAQMDRCRALHDAGWTITDIAAETGIARHQVYRVVGCKTRIARRREAS